MKKLKFRNLLLIALLITIVISGVFVWSIFNDQAPAYFPLNNPDAEYIITKNCPSGQGNVEELLITEGKAYCVEYKNPTISKEDQNGETRFFRITVGISKVDLERFYGKRVKNINGRFTTSTKQCIQNKCLDLKNSWLLLDIYNLELAE